MYLSSHWRNFSFCFQRQKAHKVWKVTYRVLFYVSSWSLVVILKMELQSFQRFPDLSDACVLSAWTRMLVAPPGWPLQGCPMQEVEPSTDKVLHHQGTYPFFVTQLFYLNLMGPGMRCDESTRSRSCGVETWVRRPTAYEQCLSFTCGRDSQEWKGGYCCIALSRFSWSKQRPGLPVLCRWH